MRADAILRNFSNMSYDRVTLIAWLVFIITLEMIVVVGSLTTSPNNRDSGLYDENWQDDIIIPEIPTEQNKILLKRAILKLLGLPENPNIANNRVPLMKRSAPSFLLNIYENSLDHVTNKSSNINEQKNRDFFLTIADLEAIKKSDSIVTFSAQRKHPTVDVKKPKKVKRMWFDVSAVPKYERMTSAELRIYRDADAKNNKHRGSFVITVHRVLRTTEDERVMLLLDSINTTAAYVGWLTLNVTKALSHWMENPRNNKGLYLSVEPIERLSRETRPEDIGIVGFKGDAARQPFIAGFFESTRLNQLRIDEQPILNDIDETIAERYRRNDMLDFETLSNANTSDDDALTYSTKSCSMKNWYVSFKELNWQDWIIAPEGYHANYCSGDCKFPTNSGVAGTIHATIQGLLHLKNPSKVPKTCCTPSGYSTISVLYFHDEHNVVLRNYKDMSAIGCGCH